MGTQAVQALYQKHSISVKTCQLSETALAMGQLVQPKGIGEVSIKPHARQSTEQVTDPMQDNC